MAAVQRAIVELHFENRDGQVTVVHPDNHVMAMSVGEAIEACRAFNKQIEFKIQFDTLLQRLAEWLREHSEFFDRAFLTTRDSGLLFLVVTKEKTFNEKLEEDLTELDLEIANDADFTLIRLAVHAIPYCTDDEANSFLSKDLALRFVARGKRE